VQNVQDIADEGLDVEKLEKTKNKKEKAQTE
jgi:hypothetical protein